MSMLIKNGTICTASDIYQGDIRIQDGKIVEIGVSLPAQDSDTVIDASGQYVLPGGIDPHTHIGHPDYVDSFESGTKAAAAGGITSIGCYLEPPSHGRNLVQTYEYMKQEASESCIDYYLNPIINNAAVQDFIDHAGELRAAGCGTVKFFMASRGMGYYSDDVSQYKMIRAARENGINVSDHCENGDVIDCMILEEIAKGHTDNIWHGRVRKTYLESEATNRFIALVRSAGATGRVVHISCREAMEEVARAQAKGLPIVGETCPHYLLKDISYLERPFEESAKNICAPPLREKCNQEALWSAIRDGVITTIGSDHAPVAFEGMPVSKVNGREAFNKVPMGCPGVEDIYPLMYSEGVAAGRISLQTFVAIMSTNPAKEYGLYPRKGSIAVGFDGDVVVLDPHKERVITAKAQYQKADFNAWEGWKCKGVITHVICRGKETIRNGEFVGTVGQGAFLPAGEIMLE